MDRLHLLLWTDCSSEVELMEAEITSSAGGWNDLFLPLRHDFVCGISNVLNALHEKRIGEESANTHIQSACLSFHE